MTLIGDGLHRYRIDCIYFLANNYGCHVTNSGKLLIHVLAVHRDVAKQTRARVTLRLGDPKPGDQVWFQGTDCVKRKLNIVDISQTSRLSTIVLSGAKADLEHLVGGTYLYGLDSVS